ncbi:MAG: hypothetical protein HY909_02110 [Deltaproteobacteria bacterium]|nr:hypothetical protein [Deltaproteobacteria bacterium]
MKANDTTSQADARYHTLLRRLSPAQRLEAAMRLSQAVREMTIAGIRQRHPGISDDELRVRLTARLYGVTQALRLFGSIPDDGS